MPRSEVLCFANCRPEAALRPDCTHRYRHPLIQERGSQMNPEGRPRLLSSFCELAGGVPESGTAENKQAPTTAAGTRKYRQKFRPALAADCLSV